MNRRSVLAVVAAGLLAFAVVVAIPNLVQMRARARDGDTKFNMHEVQVSIEAFGDAHSGKFPFSARDLAPYLRAPLVDPWTGRTMTVVFYSGPRVDVAGLRRDTVVVFRPDTARYEICGVGDADRFLSLELVGGPPGASSRDLAVPRTN